MKDGIRTFQTDDLNLVAFCLVHGARVINVVGDETGRMTLTLRPHPADGLLLAYADGTAVVNVAAFVRAFRKIRSIIRVNGWRPR